MWPYLYDLVLERYEPGRTLVLGHCLDFASRVAQEARGVPLLTVIFSPSLIRSFDAPPTLRAGMDPSRFPTWFNRFYFWLGDRFFVDPLVLPSLNALRRRAGLRPTRRPLNHWFLSPMGTLALFPDWFAPPQSDWPVAVKETGFPLYETPEPLPGDVDRFLDAGAPPIVFTPGSANAYALPFLEAAVDACHLLGRRGLFLTRWNHPISLPADVLQAPFAPLGAVLPRAAALVHHGGVGTAAAGLAAGVPQLVMPMSHDQPDTAARLKKLGVGDWLLPKQFIGPAVAGRLGRLLDDPAVRARCQTLAARVRAQDGPAEAIDAVEAFARSHTGKHLGGLP